MDIARFSFAVTILATNTLCQNACPVTGNMTSLKHKNTSMNICYYWTKKKTNYLDLLTACDGEGFLGFPFSKEENEKMHQLISFQSELVYIGHYFVFGWKNVDDFIHYQDPLYTNHEKQYPYENENFTCNMKPRPRSESRDLNEACYIMLPFSGKTCKKDCNDDQDRDLFGVCKQYYCPKYTYGDTCEKKCHNCRNGICKKDSGKCLHGCDIGFNGEPCKECLPGFWGDSCVKPCSKYCIEQDCDITDDGCVGLCHHITGACEVGCQKGFHPPMCIEPCPLSWGTNCSHMCSSHCQATTECDPLNGTCLFGCRDGFKNEKCDEPCEEGNYGQECKEVCEHCNRNETSKKHMCASTDGLCLNGCVDGHYGPYCLSTQKDSTVNWNRRLMIIISFLGFLILMLIIGVRAFYVKGSDDDGEKKFHEGVQDEERLNDDEKLSKSLNTQKQKNDPVEFPLTMAGEDLHTETIEKETSIKSHGKAKRLSGWDVTKQILTGALERDPR